MEPWLFRPIRPTSLGSPPAHHAQCYPPSGDPRTSTLVHASGSSLSYEATYKTGLVATKIHRGTTPTHQPSIGHMELQRSIPHASLQQYRYRRKNIDPCHHDRDGGRVSALGCARSSPKLHYPPRSQAEDMGYGSALRNPLLVPEDQKLYRALWKGNVTSRPLSQHRR
ncbi:hypothetical protein BJ165DRAFT_1501758 [Panaeolus papilionaceus]|nr:hypothetical protein BJ165DRAFT_1501758 [Panaeolus papilionaceus]